MNLGKTRSARSLHVLPAVVAFATLFPTAVARPAVPPRPSSAFSESDRQALVSWTMAQPEVRSAVARHRTRVLRVWSDAVKGEAGGRGTVLLRDYETGLAREISVDLASGRITMRELPGIQPNEEEIEEGMAIVRQDQALARFVENPGLRLIGGFHNRSVVRDDPCAIEVCLELAFMKPNYEGPARYVVVNLTRRVVAHHDFRGSRPGRAPARMTETGDR